MCNKALSLYFISPFEQFTTFFSEYQQDFISLMLTFYGISICYYAYILWSYFSKIDLGTEEVITAILKIIQTTTKVILNTNQVITFTLKVISTTTKVILSTNAMVSATAKVIRRSDHSHFKKYLNHYKSDLGH